MSSGKNFEGEQPETVRGELDRLLGTAELSGSDRMALFLRFVVETTLEGKAAELKESVLGVVVFGREAGYDPKADPIVRTEARRLRSKLEAIYARTGAPLGVEITVPKGGYAADFQWRPKVVPMAGPRLAINAPVPVVSPDIRPNLVAMPHPVHTSRRWWWIAGVAAVSAAGLTWGVSQWFSSPAKRPEFYIQPVLSVPGMAATPRLSPDGNQAIFAWKRRVQDPYRLYRVMSAGGDPQPMVPDAGHLDQMPSWSPDGSRIAFVRDRRELMVVTQLGETRMVTELAGFDEGPLAWTPDGKRVLAARGGPKGRALWSVAVDTKGPEELVVPAPAEGQLQFWAYSPDGRELALSHCGPATCALVVRNLASGKERKLTTENRGIVGLDWMPDGKAVVYSSFRGGRPALWIKSLDPKEDPFPLGATGLEAILPSATRGKDGKARIVYVTITPDVDLAQFALRPGLVEPGAVIARSDRREDSPRWSPDGKQIAFCSVRLGQRDLFVCDREGNNVRQVVRVERQSAFDPQWSPDGKRLAFVSLRDEGTVITVVSLDDQRPCFLTAPGPYNSIAWGPGGKDVWTVRNPNEVVALPADACGAAAQPRLVHRGDGISGVRYAENEKRMYIARGGEISSCALPECREQAEVRGVFPGWWNFGARGIYFMRVDSPRAAGPPVFDLFLKARGAAEEKLGRFAAPIEPSPSGFAVNWEGTALLAAQVADGESKLFLATEK